MAWLGSRGGRWHNWAEPVAAWRAEAPDARAVALVRGRGDPARGLRRGNDRRDRGGGGNGPRDVLSAFRRQGRPDSRADRDVSRAGADLVGAGGAVAAVAA